MPGITVLVVDDEEFQRKTTVEYLEQAGICEHARECESGVEVEAALRRENIDLVITDYGMPGMDGISVLKLIGSSFRSVKTIMISGNDAREEAELYGAKFLAKPADLRELRGMILEMFPTLKK